MEVNVKKELSIYLSTATKSLKHMTRDEFIKHARIYDWSDETLRRYKMMKASPAIIAGTFTKPLDISRFINKPSFSEYVRGLRAAYNDPERYGISPDVGFIVALPSGVDRGAVWDILFNDEGVGERVTKEMDDIVWMEYDDKAVRVCEVCIGASRLGWNPKERTVALTLQKDSNIAWGLMGSFGALDSDMSAWLSVMYCHPVRLYDAILDVLVEMSKSFRPDIAGSLLSVESGASKRDAMALFIATQPESVIETAFASYTDKAHKLPLVELWYVINDCITKIPMACGSDALLRDLGAGRNDWFWCAVGNTKHRTITVGILKHIMKMLLCEDTRRADWLYWMDSQHHARAVEVTTRHWLDREHNIRIYIDGNRQVSYSSRTDYEQSYDVMGTGTILDYILNPAYATPGTVGSAYDFLVTARRYTAVTATLSDKPVGENEI